MQRILKLVVLFFFSLAFAVYAQVPRLINYQGVLLGPDEQPVPEGEYNLTFNLYNEPGDLLWSEMHQQVFISGGMFQVHLGGINPLELPFNEIYFLGIKVNEDPEMEPRIQLSSSAYSFRSIITESIEGIHASEVPMPYHLLPLDSTGMFPPSVIPPDSGGGGGGIGGSGSPNYIPRFNSEFTLGNSVFYQSNGNIGIGTTSPTFKFELAGYDAKIYGLTIGRGGGGVGSNTAFGIEALQSNNTGFDNTAVGIQSLFSNLDGWGNVAVGLTALYQNLSSMNTAVGSEALFHNISAGANTAIGFKAMANQNGSQANYGEYNTAVGSMALTGGSVVINNSGYHNTAVGSYSLHNNETGVHNSALGMNSLSANQSGDDNTAIGYQSMSYNTNGKRNTAIGTQALYNNETQSDNTAIGTQAMYYANNTITPASTNNTAVGYGALRGSTTPANNTGTLNTAVGSSSLLQNSSGEHNTAVGNKSMMQNTTGSHNTACGVAALIDNTQGSANTAIGYNCLSNNLTGSGNTAVGWNTLNENTIGLNNTALGYHAGFYTLNTNNSTFIGYSCYAETDNFSNTAGYGYQAHPTASNQVRIGNSSVTSIGGYTNWTNISDDRYKINVREDVKGLEFVLKLRPVTYKLNMAKLARDLGENRRTNEDGKIVTEASGYDLDARKQKSQKVYSGFVAQEVEQIAKELGYEFSGIDAPKNEKDFYGLRYAEFVVPLVKAVQEQQQIIEELLKRIEALEKR